MKKISIEEIKKRIHEKHGNTVSIKEDTYINCRSKAIFIDSKYGEWTTFVTSVVLEGKKHKKRGYLERKTNKLSIEDVKKKLVDYHNDQVTIYEDTYVCAYKKAKFNDKVLSNVMICLI